MLMPIINTFKNFRDKIYHFFSLRQDASFELIDALSSNTRVQSVVALSLNPLHRRNYCSITRVLDEFYSWHIDHKKRNDELTKILSDVCIEQEHRGYYLFAVDSTPNPRRYAPTIVDLYMPPVRFQLINQ